MSHHARHIHALDKSTIRSLHSGQVIVDLVAIVKELVENALDARATAIDVKLVDRGLNSIQVKDNGHGIPEQDCLYMAKPHCTSKIASFQDIDCVTSYGFRGEALSAICAVANHVQITTRTANDSIAKQYDVDTKGSIVNAKPVNLMAGSGTLVVVESPFYNIPVRRQVAQKTALSTLKNIQDVLVKYALAHPAVRFTLMQAQSTAGTKKNTQWIKPITTDILSGIGIVFSPALADLLQSHDITESFEQMPDQSEPSIHLQCILPKIDADPTSIYRGDRVFIYVNGRPINYLKSELKDLVVMFRKRYRDVTGAVDVPVKKTPFMYMDIHVPTDEYDVNVEPSKSAIMFHNKQRLLNTFEKLLDDVYGSAMDRFFHARTLDQPPTMTAGVAEEEYEETLFLPTAPATDKVPDRSIRSASVGSTSSTKDRLPSSYSAVTPVRELPPPSLPTGYSSPKDPSEDNDEENIALDFFRNIQSGGSPNDSFISPLMEDDIVHGSSTEDRLFEQVDTSQVAADTSKGVEENEISPPSTSAQQRLFHLPSPASSKPRATELPTGGRSPKRHRSVDHAPDSVGEKRQRTLSGMFNMDRRVQSEAIASGSTRTIRPHADGDAITADASETIPLMDRNDTSSPRLSIRGPRRRNIASLMSDSETNRSYLFKTLDQEISATWDFEKIQRAFKLAADIPSEPCRVSLDEYTQSNMDPHSASSAAILKNPDNPKYSFYITKRQSSGRGSLAHEINVIDLTAIRASSIYHEMISSYELPSQPLDRPMQMRLSMTDPLFRTVASLCVRQHQIADDGHGCCGRMYSIITDKRIVANGFGLRWRIETNPSELILQVTSIASINDQYSSYDLMQLLRLISANGGHQSLEQVRPKKVLVYLEQLAKDKAEKYTHKLATDKDVSTAGEMLERLAWQEKDNFRIGIDTGDAVVACQLFQ